MLRHSHGRPAAEALLWHDDLAYGLHRLGFGIKAYPARVYEGPASQGEEESFDYSPPLGEKLQREGGDTQRERSTVPKEDHPGMRLAGGDLRSSMQ